MLYLVRADEAVEASARARSLAEGKDHTYLNHKGQDVRWRFVELVDVVEMIDQEFKDGAELKSEMVDGPDGDDGGRWLGQRRNNPSLK